MKHKICSSKYKHDICKTQCGLKRSSTKDTAIIMRRTTFRKTIQLKYEAKNIQYIIYIIKLEEQNVDKNYAAQSMQHKSCRKQYAAKNLEHKLFSSKYSAQYLQHKMFSSNIKHKICRKKNTEQNMQHQAPLITDPPPTRFTTL